MIYNNFQQFVSLNVELEKYAQHQINVNVWPREEYAPMVDVICCCNKFVIFVDLNNHHTCII